MKIVSFWNVNEKDDLEEGFYLTVEEERRGLEMLQHIANAENREYRAVFYDVKEWASEMVAYEDAEKRSLEWIPDGGETITIKPQ